MICWIQNNDIWEEEGWGKYPVFGTDEFCYFKYSDNDDESVKDLLIAHLSEEPFEGKIRRFDYFDSGWICEDLDEPICYYFYEVECAKTKKTFYLVSKEDSCFGMEESQWFFIPGRSANIDLFRYYVSKK